MDKWKYKEIGTKEDVLLKNRKYRTLKMEKPTFEEKYKDKRKDVKVLERTYGYLTKDTNIRSDKLLVEMLGLNYSYTINSFDSHNTEKAIKKFNNNMKHIRVWNEQEKNIRQFLKARVWRSSKRLKVYKKCLSI